MAFDKIHGDFHTLKEFIILNSNDICSIYAHASNISTVDIITMLFCYYVCNQTCRINNFIKALTSNKNVPKKNITGISYYVSIAMYDEHQFDVENVVESLSNYQFEKLDYFRKGSLELIKKGKVITNVCNDEVKREH